MDQPLELSKASTTPGERIIDKPELPAHGLVMRMAADVETIPGESQLKVGTSRGYTVCSDEPKQIGGTEQHPPPMSYIALGIGFCLLTQVARYASMMKIDVRGASCHVDLDYAVGGSVLKGTVQAVWREVRTHLDVDSDAPPERIAALVRNAKGGCTAENLVVQAVPLLSTVSVRGTPLPAGIQEQAL